MNALAINKGASRHSAYDLRGPFHGPEETHTLAVLVDNEAGVLARVIGLFSGRGYNIESLTVAETDHEGHLSRITIVTTGTPAVIEQIKAQLGRLVPVHDVHDLTVEGAAVQRELALIKVAGTGERRVEAMRLADVFRARVVDTTLESFVFELTGAPEKVDAFIAPDAPARPRDVARTGVAADRARTWSDRHAALLTPARRLRRAAGSGKPGACSTSRSTSPGRASPRAPPARSGGPTERLLAVADLHLCRSERLARRGGALLPPYETAATLDRLAAEIAASARPGVCLGDSFDDCAAGAALAAADAGPADRADRRPRLDLDRRQPRPRAARPARQPPGRARASARSPSATRPPATPPPARSPATGIPSSACRSAAARSAGPASSPTTPG